MKTIFFLLVTAAAVTLLQVPPCHAAPARKPINTFDQRQDGKLNVHAKLENFLFVFAPPSTNVAELSSLLPNDLIAQALELKNVASRVANRPENSEINEQSDDPVAETSIVTQINEKDLAAENAKGLDKTLKLVAILQSDLPDTVASSQSPQSNLKSEKNINAQTESEVNEKSRKTARSLAKDSNELSVSKLPPKAIDQLVPLENKVAGPNDGGNAVGSAEMREPQELKLIGGGIENCGPDRFRDRFGICQSRVDT